MPIKVGSTPVKRVYRGATEVKEVYKGADLIHRRTNIIYNALANNANFPDGSNIKTEVKTWGVEALTPPSNAIKSGYVFSGWGLTPNLNGNVITLPPLAPDTDMTYYAVFEVDLPAIPVGPQLGGALCVLEGWSGGYDYCDVHQIINVENYNDFDVSCYVQGAGTQIIPARTGVIVPYREFVITHSMVKKSTIPYTPNVTITFSAPGYRDNNMIFNQDISTTSCEVW